MHAFYVHGFASSPLSSKAVYLRERLEARGVPLHAPDFNEPDFATLTVSRMLDQLETAMAAQPPGPVVLIGSSLGGFVAVEAAARQTAQATHPIVHLILLAPAVELAWDRWEELGRGGVAAWKASGHAEIFHNGLNTKTRLNYSFYEDALRYNPAARRLSLPMLIFQGRNDETVDPASVERFARVQPNATLHLLDDGHQLKDSLPFIWNAIRDALGLRTVVEAPDVL